MVMPTGNLIGGNLVTPNQPSVLTESQIAPNLVTPLVEDRFKLTRLTGLRLATFGDSTATFGSWGQPLNNWDQEFMTLAAGIASTTLLTPTVNKLMLPFLYPSATVVAQGGISGQTTAQMLSRDGQAASVTRNSVQDVLSKSPDVILFRGGSINDITGLGLTTWATDAQISAIGLRHIALAYKLSSGGALVLDEGVAGFDAASGVIPSNQSFVRDAVVRLNNYLASFHATTGIPNVVWVDPVGVTCDEEGAFLAGATGNTDGTHLSYFGQLSVSRKESAILTTYFGNTARSAYKGINLLDSLAYFPIGGALPTGYSFGTQNCTSDGTHLEQDTNGEVCVRTTLTGLSGSPYVLLNMPINIYSGAPAPAITITSGMKLGFEYDWSIETVDGSAILPSLTFAARLNLQNSSSGRLQVEYGSSTVTGDAGNLGVSRLDFHSATQVLFNDVTANLTSSCAWRIQVFLPIISAGYKFRVKNPRIVQIA